MIKCKRAIATEVDESGTVENICFNSVLCNNTVRRERIYMWAVIWRYRAHIDELHFFIKLQAVILFFCQRAVSFFPTLEACVLIWSQALSNRLLTALWGMLSEMIVLCLASSSHSFQGFSKAKLQSTCCGARNLLCSMPGLGNLNCLLIKSCPWDQLDFHCSQTCLQQE